MQPQHSRSSLRALALGVVVFVVAPSTASADTLVANGDALVPVQPNAALHFGDVCSGTEVSKPVSFAIRNGNASPRFANAETILVTVDRVTGGIGATAGHDAITLPSDWTSRPNNAMSDTTDADEDRPAGRTTSTITLRTENLPVGPINGTVTFRASGWTRATTDRLNWHAKIVGCDATPPILELPDPVSLEAASADGAPLPVTATAVDDTDPSPTVNCDPSIGALVPIGDTTVGCSASDAFGNVAHGTFSATVSDTAPPVLVVPALIEQDPSDRNGAYVHYADVSAVDAVSRTVSPSCAPASGSWFPYGATTVTCTASDEAGNRSSAAFEIVVADRIAPVIAVPVQMIAEATEASGAAVEYQVSATDVIDGDVDHDCAPVSGSRFPLGSTTVTCSAADTSSNQVTATFPILVRDTTPPQLVTFGDLVVEANSPDGATGNVTAVATDLVDGDLEAACSPASGTRFPVGVSTITCTATDAAGNTGAVEVTLRVVDTVAPILHLPADLILEAVDHLGATATFGATSIDLVDGPIDPACTFNSGTVAPLGSTIVRCDAIDATGNRSTGAFTIYVLDRAAPTITLSSGPNDTDWSNAAVLFSWTCEDAVSGVESPTITAGVKSEGAHQRIVGRCIDRSGNITEDVRFANVDLTAPSIEAPEVAVLGEAAGVVGCSDALSGLMACDAPKMLDTGSVGRRTLLVHAEDRAGNETAMAHRYDVRYASGPCAGATGRSIQQPINADGSSVFKRGTTVPARFAVCDANGHPVSDPGVVQRVQVTHERTVRARSNESFTGRRAPDAGFRWVESAQRWVYNIGAGMPGRYTYRVSLIDGTSFRFAFTLAP